MFQNCVEGQKRVVVRPNPCWAAATYTGTKSRSTTKRHSGFCRQPPIKALHEPSSIWVGCMQRVWESVRAFRRQFICLRRLADLPRVRMLLLRGSNLAESFLVVYAYP